MLTKNRKVASGDQRWGGGPLFLASNNFLKFTYKNELTWCWPSPPPLFVKKPPRFVRPDDTHVAQGHRPRVLFVIEGPMNHMLSESQSTTVLLYPSICAILIQVHV